MCILFLLIATTAHFVNRRHTLNSTVYIGILETFVTSFPYYMSRGSKSTYQFFYASCRGCRDRSHLPILLQCPQSGLFKVQTCMSVMQLDLRICRIQAIRPFKCLEPVRKIQGSPVLLKH